MTKMVVMKILTSICFLHMACAQVPFNPAIYANPPPIPLPPSVSSVQVNLQKDGSATVNVHHLNPELANPLLGPAVAYPPPPPVTYALPPPAPAQVPVFAAPAYSPPALAAPAPLPALPAPSAVFYNPPPPPPPPPQPAPVGRTQPLCPPGMVWSCPLEKPPCDCAPFGPQADVPGLTSAVPGPYPAPYVQPNPQPAPAPVAPAPAQVMAPQPVYQPPPPPASAPAYPAPLPIYQVAAQPAVPVAPAVPVPPPQVIPYNPYFARPYASYPNQGQGQQEQQERAQQHRQEDRHKSAKPQGGNIETMIPSSNLEQELLSRQPIKPTEMLKRMGLRLKN